MPLMHLEDMCDALVGAFVKFENNQNGDFTIESERGTLGITHVERNGRHDYGPHFSYYCTNQTAQKVAQRWYEMTSNTGRYLPLQFKHALQVNQINLIMLSDMGATRFNFHVSLMTEREDRQLKNMLDLELLKFNAEGYGSYPV